MIDFGYMYNLPDFWFNNIYIHQNFKENENKIAS